MSEERVIKSCGNVFADIGLPQPNALLCLADAKIEWNDTLKEPLPDWAKDLLDKLK